MKILSYHTFPNPPDVTALCQCYRWQPAWKDHGAYDARVLNEWHASQHPLYAELNHALEGHSPAQKGTFLRWIAAAAVLGPEYGVLCHIDQMPKEGEVVNLSRPKKGKVGKIPILSLYPGVQFVAGTGVGFESFARLLLGMEPIPETDEIAFTTRLWADGWFRHMPRTGIVQDMQPPMPVKWPVDKV